MAGMDLIGAKVVHKIFGEGTVKTLSEGYITVLFAIGENPFSHPKAFDGFLATEDPGLLANLEDKKKMNWKKKEGWRKKQDWLS